jgi:hypothetical protein
MAAAPVVAYDGRGSSSPFASRFNLSRGAIIFFQISVAEIDRGVEVSIMLDPKAQHVLVGVGPVAADTEGLFARFAGEEDHVSAIRVADQAALKLGRHAQFTRFVDDLDGDFGTVTRIHWATFLR